jgi:hypothetical protein
MRLREKKWTSSEYGSPGLRCLAGKCASAMAAAVIGFIALAFSA